MVHTIESMRSQGGQQLWSLFEIGSIPPPVIFFSLIICMRYMLAHSIYLVRGVMEPLLKGASGQIIYQPERVGYHWINLQVGTTLLSVLKFLQLILNLCHPNKKMHFDIAFRY
jgi:hypothetical protein